ncbi:MAG: hypothetical protein PHG47_00860 [Sulfuricella sp.]|nr:hypothetical protein [Sulfuricella sp.]
MAEFYPETGMHEQRIPLAGSFRLVYKVKRLISFTAHKPAVRLLQHDKKHNKIIKRSQHFAKLFR